jgi:geranylgeranyl diphosphate synthase type II
MEQKINFRDELAALKEPVWQEIQKYLPTQEPFGHYEMVREYPERQGKYFRPGLVVLATAMFGGNPSRAYLTAAAMQTSEDWLLIHDDIEDHSLMRRHKPTLHELYGDELALNAGDALHMIMWKMLGDNARSWNDETGWKIFNAMNTLLLTTTEGQYLELKWIKDNKVFVSEEEYFDMIRRKTAAYTIIGPLQFGAMIAGGNEEDLRGIEAWGTPFGYAFQIWDDYMNIKTSTEKQGKETGGDILEGKRTLILSHLLEHCDPSEKNEIEKIYLKPRDQKTEEEKKYVLHLMDLHGSATYAKETAQKFAEQAKVLFDKHTAHLEDTHAKKVIRAGIEFVVNRES